MDDYDIDKGIQDLYVTLNDETEGLIKKTLETDYDEKFSGMDTITAMECMEEEVKRVWNLVILHDVLVGISDDKWDFILFDDPNALELKYKESAWLNRLNKRIEIELKLRELRDEEERSKSFVNKDKKLLIDFSDYLLETIHSVDFLNKDNEGRLELINDFLIEWWKKNE